TFFFQTNTGIRYPLVTGVQTVALPISDAAGSDPLQRAKLFPIASCRTLSPASSQRSFSHARAFRSVGVKTILVTAGASASENEASVSISESRRSRSMTRFIAARPQEDAGSNPCR